MTTATISIDETTSRATIQFRDNAGEIVASPLGADDVAMTVRPDDVAVVERDSTDVSGLTYTIRPLIAGSFILDLVVTGGRRVLPVPPDPTAIMVGNPASGKVDDSGGELVLSVP